MHGHQALDLQRLLPLGSRASSCCSTFHWRRRSMGCLCFRLTGAWPNRWLTVVRSHLTLWVIAAGWQLSWP